jgi:hypothetical protein
LASEWRFPNARRDRGRLTGQYLAVFLPPVEVSIPGKATNDFWQQGVTFGLEFRY